MKIISIFNQKGGTGKTLTTFNVAGCLAKKGYKVLCIDSDGQSNLTKRMLVNTEWTEDSPSLLNLMNGSIENVNEVIYNAPIRKQMNYNPVDIGIDIIPAVKEIYDYQITSTEVMKMIIKSITEVTEYDYCLIDCPADLNNNVYGVMAASDYLLIPMAVDSDSIAGYGLLLDTVNLVKAEFNPNLEILGVFLTGYKNTDSYDQYIKQLCQENMGKEFLSEEMISFATVCKQSSLFSIPVCYFRKNSKTAKEYISLTDELIRRMG